MTIEIVDFPSYNMVIFHSYVELTEGKHDGENRKNMETMGVVWCDPYN